MRAIRREPRSSPWNRDPVAQRTIHALPPFVLGGSVVYTSAPSQQEAGPCLALALLRALARLDPRWSAPRDENELILHRSALGGPCLLVGEKEGPSVSFSRGEGRLWAAMSGRGSVGIDVAYPEEFTGDYPFARAFTTEELDSAGTLCLGDAARGAALMWAAKEASVKATGAAFNVFDPLDVRVGTPSFREQGILFEVLADRPISTWVRTEGRGWLSVALA
jgi:hypothetical protein